MTTQALPLEEPAGTASAPPGTVPWLGPRRCGRPIVTEPEPEPAVGGADAGGCRIARAAVIRIVPAAQIADAVVAGALRPAGRESEA